MTTVERNNKQVLFQHNPETRFVALTPLEQGVDLSTLIHSLIKIQTEIGIEKSDRLCVIFEDRDSETSWTIQSVAYDKDWVRLA